LRLARAFEPRLHLEPGESAHDVVLGCALVAASRAALFGRAPSMPDLEAAFALFGFLAQAPEGLVARRRRLFRALAHDYHAQRRLVGSVPEATLRLPPQRVGELTGDWQALLGPDAG